MAENKNKDTARAWSDADAAIKTGRMDAGPKRRQSELDAKFNAVIKKADDDYTKKQSQPRKKATQQAKPAADDEDFMPADIKDKKQTMLNQRAAENYEATKEYKKGGKVSSASSRADGIAIRGKTRGKMC